MDLPGEERNKKIHAYGSKLVHDRSGQNKTTRIPKISVLAVNARARANAQNEIHGFT